MLAISSSCVPVSDHCMVYSSCVRFDCTCYPITLFLTHMHTCTHARTHTYAHTHTHTHTLPCVQCGVALGVLLIYVSGYLTIQSCSMLLRSAHVSERQTYELLGESLTMVTRHGWSLPSCNDYLLTSSSTFIVAYNYRHMVMHRLTHTLNLDHPCALFHSLF